MNASRLFLTRFDGVYDGHLGPVFDYRASYDLRIDYTQTPPLSPCADADQA